VCERRSTSSARFSARRADPSSIARPLAANQIAADVYDVDARGRIAPDHLGVLSHYDAVIWYTGDDVITRDSGMVPGTASRLANDEMLAMRQYIEEGGRLMFTGKYAGTQYAQGYEFDLEHGRACDPSTAADGCQVLSDDFLQYYLGSYLYNEDAGTKANGGLYDVMGVANPFEGLSWSFGGNSANNQDHSASFIATSGILPKDKYPQFDLRVSKNAVDVDAAALGAPAAVKAAAVPVPPQQVVKVDPVAKGIWWLSGSGNHRSIVFEFSDHLVCWANEGPLRPPGRTTISPGQ